MIKEKEAVNIRVSKQARVTLKMLAAESQITLLEMVDKILLDYKK